MTLLALFGLACALLAGPALLLAARRRGGNTLGLLPRLSLWAIAAACLWIASIAVPGGLLASGLGAAGWHSVSAGLLAFAAVLSAWPLLHGLQRLTGGQPTTESERFKQLVALPVGYRAFIVLTAGVTEEVLYRGYGIGVGATLLGGMGTALLLSLAIFTLAHWSWGVAHLASVLWAGTVLSLLFVLTHDLLACIIAHTLVDAVGVLLAPVALSRRAARGASAAP